MSPRRKNRGLSYCAIDTVFEAEEAECDAAWQNKYRRYATREHCNEITAEKKGENMV